jgi:hypothetical protein
MVCIWISRRLPTESWQHVSQKPLCHWIGGSNHANLLIKRYIIDTSPVRHNVSGDVNSPYAWRRHPSDGREQAYRPALTFYCFLSRHPMTQFASFSNRVKWYLVLIEGIYKSKQFWEELICLLSLHNLTVNNIQCLHLHKKFHPNSPIGLKVASISEV